MGGRKKQKILLKSKSNGVVRAFGFVHALAILQDGIKNKQTWEIAEKGYKFEANEIIRDTDKGVTTEA